MYESTKKTRTGTRWEGLGCCVWVHLILQRHTAYGIPQPSPGSVSPRPSSTTCCRGLVTKYPSRILSIGYLNFGHFIPGAELLVYQELFTEQSNADLAGKMTCFFSVSPMSELLPLHP